MADVKKPIYTAQLALSLLGVFKTMALMFGMALLEFLKAQKEAAEDKTAVAETNLDIERARHEIDNQNAGKSPEQIVGEFLGRGPGDGAGPGD